MKPTQFKSWGGTKTALSAYQCFYQRPLIDSASKSALAFGALRSYGDSCLNSSGTMIDMTYNNHLLDLDPQCNTLRVESGCTLSEILEVIVPKGYFLPVVPGTRFVTVGGAIANDIHGKNHHQVGTFGQFVKEFTLLRSDGNRLRCSAKHHPELFQATIGGLGLTGIILEATIELHPITSDEMQVERLPFYSLKEYVQINESSNEFPYTVAWIDSNVARKHPEQVRGIFQRARHSPEEKPNRRSHASSKNIIAFSPAFSVMNGLSIRCLNSLYFNTTRSPKTNAQHYDTFFFPLDGILNWNRVYGAAGFRQYQFVVPTQQANAVVPQLLALCKKYSHYSFISVLKSFGSIVSPGMLSFPLPGITLCLDFPNRGTKTLELLNKLDGIVLSANGRIYPAKDDRLSESHFKQGFTRWKEFSTFVDPKFESDFWKRVRGENHGR